MKIYLLRSAISFVFLIILASTIFADGPHLATEEILQRGLPEKLGTDWRKTGPTTVINNQQIPTLPDGKLLLESGVQSIKIQNYLRKDSTVKLELFETKHAAAAYSLWSLHQEQITPSQKEVYNGRYLIRFTLNSSKIPDDLNSVIDQFQATGDSMLPLLPTYLPSENKISGTEKYILGAEAISQIPAISHFSEVVDFTGGTHAAFADYKNGSGKMSIFLVEYQTPQFATDGAAKFQQDFDSLPPEEKNKRILRRVGNYVIEAIQVSDRTTAESLLGQIKYMAHVYWEGKDIKAVPLENRPPDPWIIDETIRTGNFIVAAFYWIGILGIGAILIGIFSGAAYFYWRKGRKHRLGLEDDFTDAGGMTRLNIENYLLPGAESSRNLLGKGK